MKVKQTNVISRIGIIRTISIFIEEFLENVVTIIQILVNKIFFPAKTKKSKKGRILLVSSGPFELITNCTSI